MSISNQFLILLLLQAVLSGIFLAHRELFVILVCILSSSMSIAFMIEKIAEKLGVKL